MHRAIRSSAILIATAVVVVLVDMEIQKVRGLPVGGLIGGILIGIFLKEWSVFHGLLCGLSYCGLLFLILVAIGLGSTRSAAETFSIIIGGFGIKGILTVISLVASFPLGVWLVKRIRQRKKERRS